MNAGRERGDRAQTTLDFAVGITVFLVTVAFVFTFIPGMLDPFTGGLEDETVASNRVADSLVLGTLGDPDEPYVLNRECTLAFFDAENNDEDGTFSTQYPMSGCNYEVTDALEARLGVQGHLGSGMNVRVRLVRDLTTTNSDDPDGDTGGDDDETDTLCLDETPEPHIVEANGPGSSRQCDPSGPDADVLFEVGGDPPTDTGSVVVARRTAYLEGGLADGTNDVILVVEVW